MIRAPLQRHLTKRLAEHKLFVPYLTAGVPSPQRFVEALSDLSEFADAVEVGLPYSDPMMDGPIIQDASAKALEAGVSPSSTFAMIRETRLNTDVPVVVMTYFNPIHRMGIARFAREAATAGVQGVVIPDLPLEESAELGAELSKKKTALIQMIAPNTSEERVGRIARASAGFVYAVSRLGVTGDTSELSGSVREFVGRIRPHTDLPVLLGIGISTADEAREASVGADGVIVGTAVMKKMLAGDVAGAVALGKGIRRALG